MGLTGDQGSCWCRPEDFRVSIWQGNEQRTVGNELRNGQLLRHGHDALLGVDDAKEVGHVRMLQHLHVCGVPLSNSLAVVRCIT